MDRDTLETLLHHYFASTPTVAADAVYLYGSRARGTPGPASDVDVGVLLREASPAVFPTPALLIENDLENRIHLPVQVVSLREAPVDLVHRVLRDGRLVWETDRSRRIAFEVRVRQQYFDLEPIRKAYREPSGAR